MPRGVGKRRVGSSESIVPGIEVVCPGTSREPGSPPGKRGECDLIPLESRRRGDFISRNGAHDLQRRVHHGRILETGEEADRTLVTPALQKPLSPIRTAICRFVRKSRVFLFSPLFILQSLLPFFKCKSKTRLRTVSALNLIKVCLSRELLKERKKAINRIILRGMQTAHERAEKDGSIRVPDHLGTSVSRVYTHWR